MHDFVQFFTRTCNESSSIDHLNTEWVQMTFSTGALQLDNHHLSAGWSLGSMCPDLAESNSQLACISAGQCPKFRYNTPSFAVLFTLNNPQDLGPEYLKASFLAKWTLAHDSAGKPQCGVIGVCRCLVLLKQMSPFEKQRTYGSNSCSTMWSQ